MTTWQPEFAGRTEPEGPHKRWLPTQPGDTIQGTVVEIRTAHSSFGEFPVYVVEDEHGSQVDVPAGRHVLRQQLEQAVVGSELAIRYDGQPVGKRYHSYSTVFRPGTPTALTSLRRDLVDPF